MRKPIVAAGTVHALAAAVTLGVSRAQTQTPPPSGEPKPTVVEMPGECLKACTVAWEELTRGREGRAAIARPENFDVRVRADREFFYVSFIGKVEVTPLPDGGKRIVERYRGEFVTTVRRSDYKITRTERAF